MKSIEVRAGAHCYPVLIGAGLLPELGALVRPRVRGERCALVADAKVARLFGGTVEQSLRAVGFTVTSIAIAGGETAKSMPQAAALCEQMSAAGLDRSSFLVSLGGGVVGDLAGFVAAIYLRGIPYVSLPTTLLAQVDSCIGGKTGVNSSAGKNLIGSFHHPTLVLADTETLRSLPDRIWHEGFAEAIKHGIICDAELFAALGSVDRAHPEAFIERNIALKAGIVAADEREENDLRSLLNFGHTIGHAIERAAGYGNMLHGEAISLGLVAAAHVSVRRAGLSLGEAAQIRAALEAQQLPVALPPDFPRAEIFTALPRDKKFENGRVRFVVAHAIGRASVSDEVTMEDLHAAVDAL
ncbi:MAG: 3-dehydroquinate synthase [Spartobacteria bacterium]